MQVYLFVHVILTVEERAPLLARPLRAVLFAQVERTAGERGISVLAVNGMEDHAHLLIRMHAAQNLTQVVNYLKAEMASWINSNQLLKQAFEWQADYAAYSVSPSAVKQVVEFIQKQEDYHKSRTLDTELEVFDSIRM